MYRWQMWRGKNKEESELAHLQVPGGNMVQLRLEPGTFWYVLLSDIYMSLGK
jgi:hypothetical protein